MSEDQQEFTLRTHEFRKDPATGRARLVRENHYIRLKQGLKGSPVYVQGGRIWTESGKDLTDHPPKWFWEEAKRVSEHHQRLVGLDKILAEYDEIEEAEKVDERAEKLAGCETSDEKVFEDRAGLWECPACSQMLRPKGKPAHINMHRKRGEWEAEFEEAG